jgi:hypothetical protein
MAGLVDGELRPREVFPLERVRCRQGEQAAEDEEEPWSKAGSYQSFKCCPALSKQWHETHLENTIKRLAPSDCCLIGCHIALTVPPSRKHTRTGSSEEFTELAASPADASKGFGQRQTFDMMLVVRKKMEMTVKFVEYRAYRLG